MPKYYGNLEALKPQQKYILLRQLHNARRAGLHTDVRIGAPQLGLFSWAAPKDLPIVQNQKRLLITQPLHTYEYKDFQGILRSKYGEGTVKKLQQSPIIILQNTGDKIKFKRDLKQDTPVYTMVKTKNGNWITTMKKAASIAKIAKIKALYKRSNTFKQKFIDRPLRQLKYIKDGILANPKEALKAVGYGAQSTAYNFARPVVNAHAKAYHTTVGDLHRTSRFLPKGNKITPMLGSLKDNIKKYNNQYNNYIDNRQKYMTQKLGLKQGQTVATSAKIPGTNISWGNTGRNLTYALMAGNAAAKAATALQSSAANYINAPSLINGASTAYHTYNLADAVNPSNAMKYIK